MLKVKFLHAFNGDCILLTFSSKEGDEKLVLIDGGIRSTYRLAKNKKGKPEDGELKSLVDQLRKSKKVIDLLILTHVDDDHISGILEWFEQDSKAHEILREVWFNSGALIAEHFKSEENGDLDPEFKRYGSKTNTSIPQGIKFGNYIAEKGIWNRELFIIGKYKRWNNAEFRFLSPNERKLESLLKEWKKKDPDLSTSSKFDDYHFSLKHLLDRDKFTEDSAYPNGSSIAFILTFQNKNFLFLGDSHPSVIVEGLSKAGFSKTNPLYAEFVKLSHHGSSGNTSVDLLGMISSPLYIVSTNGQTHMHPHKQLLARLINQTPGCTIYFNYKERMDKIFLTEDFHDFKFKTTHLPDELAYENGKG